MLNTYKERPNEKYNFKSSSVFIFTALLSLNFQYRQQRSR
jgi:hypothetical protein